MEKTNKDTKKVNAQLTAPWISYYHKMLTFFGQDEDINILYNEDDGELTIYVRDADKAAILDRVLPDKKTWGNVEMAIKVIPGNQKLYDFLEDDLFDILFDGNPIYVQSHTLDYEELSNKMTFVEFAPMVAQYYDDNISSLTGLSSCLYEDLARELFEGLEGVYFSTVRNA